MARMKFYPMGCVCLLASVASTTYFLLSTAEEIEIPSQPNLGGGETAPTRVEESENTSAHVHQAIGDGDSARQLVSLLQDARVLHKASRLFSLINERNIAEAEISALTRDPAIAAILQLTDFRSSTDKLEQLSHVLSLYKSIFGGTKFGIFTLTLCCACCFFIGLSSSVIFSTRTDKESTAEPAKGESIQTPAILVGPAKLNDDSSPGLDTPRRRKMAQLMTGSPVFGPTGDSPLRRVELSPRSSTDGGKRVSVESDRWSTRDEAEFAAHMEDEKEKIRKRIQQENSPRVKERQAECAVACEELFGKLKVSIDAVRKSKTEKNGQEGVPTNEAGDGPKDGEANAENAKSDERELGALIQRIYELFEGMDKLFTTHSARFGAFTLCCNKILEIEGLYMLQDAGKLCPAAKERAEKSLEKIVPYIWGM